MSETRLLAPEDLEAMARIFSDAYPGLKIASPADLQRFQERVLKMHEEDPTASFHGLFREGRLLGIMCLYDFSMNFRQSQVPTGGIGQVAVALDHKKEHVAKEMMLYSLRHFRERGTPFVALYPFRPDFYRRMGFGYGTKMSQYRLRPSALPKGPSSRRARYLVEEDKRALADCYQRVAGRTHGMMEKTERELRRIFGNPQHRVVGYEQDGQIRGYLAFAWEHGDSFIVNDIQITEFIYEDREALLALTTFLHTQADQVRHVLLNTQDQDFHHLLLDPRNDSERLIPDVYHETNAQGVGLMYRVVDVPGIFNKLVECEFGTPDSSAGTLILSIAIHDSLLPENSGSILLRFDGRRGRLLDEGQADVKVSLTIEDFSSLLSGTVRFNSLFRYGLADISDDAYVDTVARIFAVEQKPVCTTGF